MAASFTSVLDAPIESAERPKPIPVGTYLVRVDGQPNMDKSPKTLTEFAEFTFKVMSPGEDVDAEQLEEYGGMAKLAGKTIKRRFYLTDDSYFMLKDFIAACGVEMAGKSGRQAVAETSGCQVNALVTQTPTQDNQGLRSEIKSFSAV